MKSVVERLQAATQLSMLVLAAAGAGCVTEADRRDATRIRRPAMPAMAGTPGEIVPAPAEAEIQGIVQRAALAGDLGRARREIDRMADHGGRERVARTVAAALAARDPEAALTWAHQLGPGLPQVAAAEEAARARVQLAPGPAAGWAAEFADPELATIVRRVVAEALVAADVSAALRQVEAAPAGAGREELLGLVAAAWVRRDPGAAERWLRATADGARRSQLAARMGVALAQTDPRRAVALAELVPAGRDRWLLTSAITQTWVAVDPEAAFAWTRQQAAGEAREAAVAGLDAGLGVAVARRVTAAPDTRSGAGRRAGGGVIGEQLAAGTSFAAWLALQPATVSQEEAWSEYARQRGALEPQVVGQWLETLPGGPARERATEVYWETLLATAPAEAARWLEQQPRSERTPERLERTAREWSRRNPGAAATWLRAQPLPPDRVEWVLQEGR